VDRRQERLLEKVRETRGNCRFYDLSRMLEAFGYVRRKIASSHVIFRRPGSLALSIPKRTPLKRFYVEAALAAALAEESESHE
jgi:hypothetical protein